MRQILLIILLIATCTNIKAEESHEGHTHAGKSYEIAAGAGYSYSFSEKEYSPAIHLHITHRLSESFPLLMGVGAEFMLGHHKHTSAGIILGYNIWKELIISSTTGFVLEDSSTKFAIHFECSYGFPVGPIHIGPIVEYAYSKHDSHVMLGIHIGLPF